MINRGDIKLAIDMVVNAQDDRLFGGEVEYVINTLEDCGNEIVSQRKQIETNAHECRHVRWKLKDTLTSTPEVALNEVRKAERERCAKVCEELRHPDGYSGENVDWCAGTDHCATAIRAMGDE